MSSNQYLVIILATNNSESLPEKNCGCEGHSAAGWGIGGSVIAADCGVQSPFVRAMGCRYLRCTTCAITGQYPTSHCKPQLFWCPCKRQYINVQTFLNLLQYSLRLFLVATCLWLGHSGNCQIYSWQPICRGDIWADEVNTDRSHVSCK